MTQSSSSSLRAKLIKIVDPMVYADGSIHKDDTRIDEIIELVLDELEKLVKNLTAVDELIDSRELREQIKSLKGE